MQIILFTLGSQRSDFKKIEISKKKFIFINNKTDLLKKLSHHLKKKYVRKNFKATKNHYTKINKNIKLFY